MARSMCFLHLSAICYLILKKKNKAYSTMHVFESTISRDADILPKVVCL